jgi:hypothetical protein
MTAISGKMNRTGRRAHLMNEITTSCGLRLEILPKIVKTM